MNKAIEQFTETSSNYEKGLFIEAFVNPKAILRKSQIGDGLLLFIVKVNEKYPYCLILEYSQEEALYFQTFRDLESANELYNHLRILYVN